MTDTIANKLVADIHATPVFERHMWKRGVFTGATQMYVAPIMIWAHTIEVRLDNKRNYYKKALEKFAKDHPELEYAHFIKNGKDCTPYLLFRVKE